MDKWNRKRGKRTEGITDPATNPGPKPGDFALGSLESRAAARAMLEGKSEPEKVIRVVFVGKGPPDEELPEPQKAIPGSNVRIEYEYADSLQEEE